MAASTALLAVSIKRVDPARCPFENDEVAFELCAGDVIWLRGPSGSGKSMSCLHIAGLTELPGAVVDAQWDKTVPKRERLGFLFQQGVLIDSLSLAENIALAISSAGRERCQHEIRESLQAVGLNAASDGSKMPGELSGGMLRRAALAQILACRKRVVVLDEPFVGLDAPVAAEIAQLLLQVVRERGIALLLISHIEAMATKLQPSRVIDIRKRRVAESHSSWRGELARLPFTRRAGRRLADYLLYSLPLVICAFAATGAAVSMLLADLLNRVDVVKIIASFLQAHLAGNPALPMIMALVDQVVKANEAAAKKKLYALALGTIFSIELGPLLTGLLMAGRIGGAFAGEVATMAATRQLELLSLLGVHPLQWAFAPALVAALIAAPILTAVGTAVALAVGATVGRCFELMDEAEFASEVQEAVLRWPADLPALQYAPLVNVYRSLAFMLAIMVVAQCCGVARKRAQPRHVPMLITSAVVVSCLLVLCLDWALSQLYIHAGRHIVHPGLNMHQVFDSGALDAVAGQDAHEDMYDEFDDDGDFEGQTLMPDAHLSASSRDEL